ncbi:MAG TPA: ATP-binding protein, partial [Kofleriaceae bacterium]|nr:ATP-binding protein [Kofleriaceae bacterium]
ELDFFEISLDHLCVAGFDGYWKRLNAAWTRTLGWTKQELMAVPLIEFVHPDDREPTLDARNRLKDGVPLQTLANRYRRRDGTYCWFEWRSVSDPDRQLVYAIARDISAEKEAQRTMTEARALEERVQRQLIVADRMASLGTLAAGIAHEINNPLAYVISNLDLLVEELQGLEDGRATSWREMIGDALDGAERIRKIVRGLKAFGRTNEENRAVIMIEPMIERAIELVSNEIRHRARLVRAYGEAPPVEADEARLAQVMINLLVNAAQAIPEGDVDGHEIRVVTATDADGRAVIEVHDSGCGIPAETLDRVFDPFFTTKPVGVGTGLGLSICHTIVGTFGGEITAANRPDRGAVFRIALPAAYARSRAPRQADVVVAAPATRRTAVLVVDDEQMVATSVQRMLREHEVTAVNSGRDAIELVRAGRSFDVIISDLMMPEMSGMELYDHIVRERPQLAERMVFITGGAFTPSAAEFLDRVPNERIEKPFSVATVRDVVRRLGR